MSTTTNNQNSSPEGIPTADEIINDILNSRSVKDIKKDLEQFLFSWISDEDNKCLNVLQTKDMLYSYQILSEVLEKIGKLSDYKILIGK